MLSQRPEFVSLNSCFLTKKARPLQPRSLNLSKPVNISRSRNSLASKAFDNVCEPYIVCSDHFLYFFQINFADYTHYVQQAYFILYLTKNLIPVWNLHTSVAISQKTFIFARSQPSLDCSSVEELIMPWFCSEEYFRRHSLVVTRKPFSLYRDLTLAHVNGS